MFVDRVRIKVTSGGGGRGCCSFRREKYVPHGGPNGGDGGDGGDVCIVADSKRSSLNNVRFHSQWIGDRGEHGRGSDEHGKRGEELLIHVPPGTVVRDWETKEVRCDLAEEGQRFVAAAGGRGGKGNARFATSTNRAPQFAELGEPGEDFEFELELKLIADLGIVGLPNAGKSTFLSRVTAANPKIADYPFTTLIPNLGVISLSDFRTMTIADIPGIIKGAAQGKGLGHDFLRHIERTKVLLFIIDTGDEDPMETLAILENELEQHSAVFRTRSRLVAFNKSDLTGYDERYASLEDRPPASHLISAVTGDGVPDLLEALWTQLEAHERAAELSGDEAVPAEAEYAYEAPYSVEATDAGYRIDGKIILRAVRMTDFENDEAVSHLERKLKKMGLFSALKRLGARGGDTIFIGDTELKYYPE